MALPKKQSIHFLTIVCLSTFTFSCGYFGQASRGDSSSTKSTKIVSKDLTLSDLYLPYPIMPVGAASDSRMSIVDFLGKGNSESVAKHLSLKTKVDSVNDHMESKEQERFWLLDPSNPKAKPAGRYEPLFRECLEEPSNMVLNAIRFAPYETVLPGALEDWKLAFPKYEFAKKIELRMVFKLNCGTDDAAVHVIYTLGNDESLKTLNSVSTEVSKLVGKNDTTSTNEISVQAKRLNDLFSSKEYQNVRASLIDRWSQATRAVKDKAVVPAGLKSFSQNFISAATKNGFDFPLKSLVQISLGQKPDLNSRLPEIGIESLKDLSTDQSKDFHKFLQQLVGKEAQLSVVTTFALIGFEVWTFGKLQIDEKTKTLQPVPMETLDTFFQIPKTGTDKALILRKTSTLGIYENAVEMDESSRSSTSKASTSMEYAEEVLKTRIESWADFSKSNVFRMQKSLEKSSDPRTSSSPLPISEFVEMTTQLEKINSSNMTCANCHVSLQNGQVGAGANLHMLTDFSKRMNARTASELNSELEKLKSEFPKSP